MEKTPSTGMKTWKSANKQEVHKQNSYASQMVFCSRDNAPKAVEEKTTHNCRDLNRSVPIASLFSLTLALTQSPEYNEQSGKAQKHISVPGQSTAHESLVRIFKKELRCTRLIHFSINTDQHLKQEGILLNWKCFGILLQKTITDNKED